MVLPAGTRLPPLLHGLAVLLALVGVGTALYRARPRVRAPHVLALAPWMAAGAVLYVLYQVELVTGALAPLFGSPTVYATTGVAAGATWLGALWTGRDAVRTLGVAGAAAALVPAAVALSWAAGEGTLAVWPAAASVLGAAAMTATVWTALARLAPTATGVTGAAGLLVVAGHALDAVSTAVGVGYLGVAEQTPLSRAVIEAGAALPPAPYVGGTWLFVVVKATLASGLVVLFTEYVRDEPAQAFLLLALLAGVGLGPGTHNVLLFAVTGG
jgi:uncharacterized membrane protein